MNKEILEALTIIEEEENRTKKDIEIIIQAKQEIERLNKENEELKNIQCTFLGTGCKLEIERLHSIINEAKETIKDKRKTMTSKLLSGGRCNYEELLYQLDEEIWGILDKVEEK